MGKPMQATVGSKKLTNVDGSPMMVPAMGKAKAYNVAKGMLQSSLPDMTLAIT